MTMKHQKFDLDRVAEVLEHLQKAHRAQAEAAARLRDAATTAMYADMIHYANQIFDIAFESLASGNTIELSNRELSEIRHRLRKEQEGADDA